MITAACRGRHLPPSPSSKAFFATIRGLRQPPTPEAIDPEDSTENDFILSILRARPSLRDTKSYLASFGPRPQPTPAPSPATTPEDPPRLLPLTPPIQAPLAPAVEKENPLITSILNPIQQRTALVKVQGPFNDIQLASIARGLVYLEKLGLVSVIVVDRDDWHMNEKGDRTDAVNETMRVASALEQQGARARPVLETVVRLGPKPNDDDDVTHDAAAPEPPEAHALPNDLRAIRSALRAGEIPVLPPVALDSFCRSLRIDANDVVAALTRAMVEAGDAGPSDVDMTPLRLMIINREGGVPSYARGGLPHLLVNLTSEHDHIRETFLPQWEQTHPTALANISLARTCLSYMPRTSSAIVVSHRSPSSLIANLITNKPAQSSSLPHALLSGTKKLTPHTPTLFRHGLPIRVIRSPAAIDQDRLTALLEKSFGRTLDKDAFYERINKRLDFAIVAGDYAGAAIVTNESHPTDPSAPPIAYLDKFAVLPSHQGDGTVDFLWVALHDESYGLGLPYSVNPNGGMEGLGTGRDLVWRSRADNPVNKWYFERSTGHLRLGKWVLFWCDAEERLRRAEEAKRTAAEAKAVLSRKMEGLSYIEAGESGRLSHWAEVVESIPSSWSV